jgi:2,5-diketo-D-gluconate reductase A
MTTVELARGSRMPAVGLGTYPLDDDQVAEAVDIAIRSGYRLIDTAEGYGNETGIGRGIARSGVDRGEIFVTTKFNREWHGRDLVQRAWDAATTRLGVDYLDLFMIHWPVPEHGRYVEAFQGLLELFENGQIRAVGVSNFKKSHLERLFQETGQRPDVNQIQCSPAHARTALRDYHREVGIATNAWAPLGGKRHELLESETVGSIAARLGVSVGQVIIRWHVQVGTIPIAMSSNPERIRANLDVFSFSLSDDQMDALAALDLGESAAVDSDTAGH